MNFVPDNLYHIFNQGNNHQKIFANHEDYLIFMREMRVCICPFMELIAYCLMPNHFHLMSYVDLRVAERIKQGGLTLDPLTNGFRKLLSSYTRIHNLKYQRSGSLFRQKTKSKCLSDKILLNPQYSFQDYYQNCFNYIHQNPVKASLVERLEDWEYSSYKDYARLRNGTLCNKTLAEKYCNYQTSTFHEDSCCLVDDSFGRMIMI